MFNFLKKKEKNDFEKTSEAVVNNSSKYSPWDNSQNNSDTEFANAVFLHIHTKPIGKPDSPDRYPRYVSYELGITNPIKKFNDMLFSGMLEQSDHTAALTVMKVTELKEILKKYNLPTNGKKVDLIERITSEINIKSLGLPKMYTVSEKGKVYLKQHEDLIKLHGNPYNISYEEYKAAKNSCPPYLKYNDVIWSIFNNREMQISIADNSSRRNNYLYRAEFLKKENRLADALLMFATVLYYDIHIDINAGINPEEFIIAPALVTYLVELKDYYNDEIIGRCFRRDVYPKKIITPKGFERLLKDVFAVNFKSLEKYL